MTMSEREQRKVAVLGEAIKEAERFLLRAKLAVSAIRLGKEPCYSPSLAAAKRASMDLTRALADVRRNGGGRQ